MIFTGFTGSTGSTGRLPRIDVGSLTDGKPFTAGVVALVDGKVVLTLNGDHLPPELAGRSLRVGGLGGGQEPGETIVECAVREAQEELSTAVELVSSPVTYLYAPEAAERRVACTDTIAPLALFHARRVDPTPFRPGLPGGYDVFSGLYLGRICGQASPGDDVEALLLLPATSWDALEREPTLGEVLAAGLGLIEAEAIPRATRLWVHPREAFREAVRLLPAHPEVMALLA